MLRRLCTNTGAFAPLRHDNDTTLRAGERVQSGARPAGQGLESNRHCGWVVGAS